MPRDLPTASFVLRTPPPPRQKTRERHDELERVTLLVQAEGDDGELIPAGASGTVVAVWSGGSSYDVEFTEPVSALATVPATAIEKAWPVQG